jgi:LPXTG-motif cell wall-anchored protein
MTRRPYALALLVLAVAALPARAASTTVDAVDSAFRPRTVTVAVGDTVTWRNTGAMPHTATSKAFDSGNLDPGRTFAWRATKVGTYAYVCRYHEAAGMTGTVVVRASGLPNTGGDHVALGLLVLGVAGVAGASLRYGWRVR